MKYIKFNEIENTTFMAGEYVTAYKTKERPKGRTLVSSGQIVEYLSEKEMYEGNDMFDIELVSVVAMNMARKAIGFQILAAGAEYACLIDIRKLFIFLLQVRAKSFVVVHNHPSGRLQPSEADKVLAKKIKAGSETLDIKCDDFLIVSDDYRYYSFRDENIL